MFARHRADPVKLVHIAQVRGAGRTDHQPRFKSLCPVGADHLRQGGRVHAKVGIGVHFAHDTAAQAGDMQGFGDAMMGKPGVIHRGPRVVFSFQAVGFPGRYETRQRSDAAPRGQHALRRTRAVAHQFRHPVQQLVFHAHRAGGTGKLTGIFIHHRRHVIPQGRVIHAARGYIAEELAGYGTERLVIHVFLVDAQDFLYFHALLGNRGIIEPGAHVLGKDKRRPFREGLQEPFGIVVDRAQQLPAAARIRLDDAGLFREVVDLPDQFFHRYLGNRIIGVRVKWSGSGYMGSE